MVHALKALLSRSASPIMRANDPSSTMPLRFHCLTNSLPRCPYRFFDILLPFIPLPFFILPQPSVASYFPGTSDERSYPSVAIPVASQSPCAQQHLNWLYYSWQSIVYGYRPKKAHTRVVPSRQIGSAFPPFRFLLSRHYSPPVKFSLSDGTDFICSYTI